MKLKKILKSYARIKVTIHTAGGKKYSTKSLTPYTSMLAAKIAIPNLKLLVQEQIRILTEEGEPTISILDKTFVIKDLENISYKATYF